MVLDSLASLHQAFSDHLLENAPPASNDVRYQVRTRLFNRTREDIAKRWFFKHLLKEAELEVVNGTASYDLEEDFEKPNGLYVLASSSGNILYTSPYERSSLITISRNFETGRYQVTFTPTPTEADDAPYWYFATPPAMVQDDDLVLVDGEATLWGSLKHHYFINGPLDKFAESRDEYENIIDELTKSAAIPAPGELIGMSNSRIRGAGTTSEKHFYQNSRRRSW